MNATIDYTSVNQHPSSDILASFAAYQLSEDTQILVQEHLATCDDCAGSANIALRAFGLIDQWDARAHGTAYRWDRLRAALEAASRQPALAAWRDRLTHWSEQWVGQAQGIVQVVFEGTSSAARIVTDGMQDLVRPGPAWQFALVPTARPILGSGRRRGQVPPVVVKASGEGTTVAQVAASGGRGEVEVQLSGLPIGVQPPLVMLVPSDHEGEPRLALPACLPDGDTWLARFSGLEPGDYLVAFEPLT
jgi:hypothetical protein